LTIETTDWIGNAKQVRELLSVSHRQVYRMREMGLPEAGKNKYHMPSVIRWFTTDRVSENAGDINEQRKLLYKAQTDKTELENSRLRADLLDTAVVHTAMLELATLVRTQIEAIEPRLARQFGVENAALLRVELKQALEVISDAVSTFADTRDDSRDHPSAS